MREKLKNENNNWRKERNFWIKEIEKPEELKHAETKFSEELLHEELDESKKELKKEKAVIRMERDEKIKQLKYAMDLERGHWRQEREKVLMDLENVRKQRNKTERKAGD